MKLDQRRSATIYYVVTGVVLVWLAETQLLEVCWACVGGTAAINISPVLEKLQRGLVAGAGEPNTAHF